MIPVLEVGDWVRAREGSPELVAVARIGTWQGQVCAYDAVGGALFAEQVVEVRKRSGERWVHPDLDPANADLHERDRAQKTRPGTVEPSGEGEPPQ